MNSGESKPRFLSNAGFSLYAGLDKSIYTLFAVRIINRFGDFVQMLLVLILTVKLGMSDHEAGLFITFTIIATMVGQLTAGVVADKLARKYVLVFCQLMICVSYLLCAVFIESAFFSLVPLLILLGSPFRGATHPITSSMVADFSSESDRGRSFSLLYLGTNIGVALGPMAAAFLYARSLPLLFAGSSGLLLISTIVLWIKVPLLRSDVFISASPKSEKGFVSVLFKNKILLLFLLFFSIYNFTYAQNTFVLPLQFTEVFGVVAGVGNFGFLMTVNAVTVLFFTPILTRLTHRKSQLENMYLAMVFYVVGYGMYAFCSHFLAFLLATFIWTLGEILMATNANVFLNAYAPPRYRARFNAVTNIAAGFGSALAPTVGGLLLVGESYEFLWSLMSFLCLVLGMGFFYLQRFLQK